MSLRNLFPPLLWPLFLAALGRARRDARPSPPLGGPDHRLLFLSHAALVAAALAAAGPVLGIIDVRFVPFAQLALCLAGAAAMGLLVGRLAAPDLAALALVGLAILYGDASSRVLRFWIDWNYTGLEAKEIWPAFRRMTASIAGGVGDPRVAVEYGAEHEKAGSIRMYETLPFFSGRSTLEGVYNQASVITHPVYYLASELGATSPNPFRKREYSRFDPDGALAHLRLFNVSEVVAVSAQLAATLQRGPGSSASRGCRPTPSSAFPRTGWATWSRWPSRPCARRPAAGATSRTGGSRASPSAARISCSPTTPRSRWSRRTSGWRRPRSRCPAGWRRTRRSPRSRSRSPPTASAIRCWSRSRTTRAGGRTARTDRTSSPRG